MWCRLREEAAQGVLAVELRYRGDRGPPAVQVFLAVQAKQQPQLRDQSEQRPDPIATFLVAEQFDRFGLEPETALDPEGEPEAGAEFPEAAIHPGEDVILRDAIPVRFLAAAAAEGESPAPEGLWQWSEDQPRPEFPAQHLDRNRESPRARFSVLQREGQKEEEEINDCVVTHGLV